MKIEKFYNLVKQGLSLDIIYLLKQIKAGISISDDSTKIKTLLHTLLRKGLLTEDGKLTIEAENLITFSDDESVETIVKTKVPEDAFKAFWEAFPSRDTFSYNNMEFEGDRTLRMNETECRIKFNAIVKEGKYSATEITEAMKYDVLQKMKNSYKTRQNKLTYLQNILTYLRQKSFVPYIDVAKTKKKETPKFDVYSGCDV